MVHLFVLGSRSDSELADAICTALSSRFQIVAVHAGNRVESNGVQPDFLLLECEDAAPDPSGQNIVICKRGFQPQKFGGDCRNTVGIVQSDHLAAVKTLSKWQIPVISCGMASTDTLTFSSVSADSAVVCLQRAIPTLQGSVVEPAEIRLTLSRPYSDYALMCIAAVLLLSGKLDGAREIEL